MNPITNLVLVFWTAIAQGGGLAGPSADLTAARGLYASGAYEEALTRLSTMPEDASTSEAAQYRALCLLALGRTAEAQRSLEDLIGRLPLVKMSEAEVAPRLVAMFHDARKRLLPAAVKDMYVKGKASFEQKQYATASSQFSTLLTLIADEDLADQTAALADLKVLGEGFLRLAEGELAAAAKAEVKPVGNSAVNPAVKPDTKPDTKADSTAGPDAAGLPVVTAPAPSTVYTAADKDVVPPVDVVRKMPDWHPPTTVAERQEYGGLLRVVINERGTVESAALLDPISASYDPVLLAAARLWQFKPAPKNGQAVKYEKLIAITLKPK